MKNTLQLKLYQFIKNHSLEEKRILIAVSAGLDSMALLNLFIGLKERLKLDLHVVHVHHGWRKESDEEFRFLEDYSRKNGIGFSGTLLNLNSDSADCENKAREARYTFFRQVYETLEADGLFLAHHKQDLEETVVKRLYEGAHLINLGCMQKSSKLGPMQLFRPLLEINKKTLIKYVEEVKIPYFEDHTNSDPKFLRTRLRQDFFPSLEKIFGKKKGESLSFLSQEAQLLHTYFEKRFDKEVLVTHPSSLNQAIYFPKTLEFFEIYHFLLIFFKRQSLTVSRDILQNLSEAVEDSTSPKNFILKAFSLMASKNFCVLIFEEKTDLLEHNSDDLDKALWIYEDRAGMDLEKLPNWFYNKVPTLRSKNKFFLNYYPSFTNETKYIRLI
jgi:tRNA(Ile)-lysidine synthase